MNDPLVEKHLILTHDGECEGEGHELISRACIHCGLTIHQISDTNDGRLPLRDTHQEREATKAFYKRELKKAQDNVIEALEYVEEVLRWIDE